MSRSLLPAILQQFTGFTHEKRVVGEVAKGEGSVIPRRKPYHALYRGHWPDMWEKKSVTPFAE